MKPQFDRINVINEFKVPNWNGDACECPPDTWEENYWNDSTNQNERRCRCNDGNAFINDQGTCEPCQMDYNFNSNLNKCCHHSLDQGF